MPLISVVIPLHNKGSHIKRTIDSVLSQSFQDYEVIVVDDASTDDGPTKVMEYKDARIQLIRRDQPGPGGYAARNLGIEKAKGEWIAFLDADDEWMCSHLSDFVDFLNKNINFNIYSCGYKKSFGGNKVFISRRAERFIDRCGVQLLSFDEYLESLIRSEQAVWTSATIVRKAIFSEAGVFPEGKAKRGGDTDTWLRVAFASSGVAWNSVISVIYHMDAENRVMLTPKNYGKENIIYDTCDHIISKSYSRKTINLLRKVKAKKFYELSMARKMHSRNSFYSLPEIRTEFFLYAPRNIAVLIPDPLYKIIKRVFKR